MKYTITVEEVLTYNREFTIDIPDDMSEGKLNSILDHAQEQANKYEDFSSIYYALEDHKIKILEYADDDTHCPTKAEFEITEMDKDVPNFNDEEDEEDFE